MNALAFEILFYGCEAVIFGSLYVNLLQRKVKTWYFLLFWAEAFVLGTAMTPSFSIVRAALMAAFELAVVILSFEENLKTKMLRFLLVETISAVCAVLSYMLTATFIGQKASFPAAFAGENCTCALLYIIVLSIAASMVFQYSKKIEKLELSWVIGTQLVIGVGECSAVLAYARVNGSVIVKDASLLFIISVACLVVANLSVGILSSFLVQKLTFNRGIDFGQEISNMEYKYYEMSVENDKKLQSLRHEIANQIQTVYSLLANGESQKSLELMDELSARYGHVDQLVYCENPVLNIILANKKAEAEKNGIDVQIKVREFPKELPISDFDLSTVVCNLFDNAIRGCVCSNQSHPRLVVEIVEKNKYLVIRMLNSCIVNMSIESTDRIETTKSNSQTHGFGMPIIAGIVRRYRGDFVVSAQNGLFTATAIMSIK